LEQQKYELTYSGDLLVKVTPIQARRLIALWICQAMARQKIRDWYRNELTEQSTTEYLTEFLKEILRLGNPGMGIKTEWD
jgi:hypothetical protein